jgi:AraC family transcriptional regulator of adaptative response/methylated-DNA-[protein]-cysteine methyltransferase
MNINTSAEWRASETLADPRWAAVAARDRSADGRFVYSVRTTGVYCRPSCAARPARPENVAFHADGPAAQRAGFRPCKRCVPDGPTLDERHAAIVADLCRLIDAAEAPLSLDELAAHARLSAYHLHRLFRRVTGLTPKAYAGAQRAHRVRCELTRSDSVTDAIYAAGYQSNGRFYAEADAALGMTPTRYRAGGADAEIRYAIGVCTLGAILVGCSDRGVCAITLGDDPAALADELRRRFPRARLVGGDADFEQVVAQVVGLVEQPAQGITLPLDVRGTAFQHRVWQALRELPVGATLSYGELAERIGAPKAVRAVAQACAANPVAVAIPCHRVVRGDGSLAGYRWGIERKRALLQREAAT